MNASAVGATSDKASAAVVAPPAAAASTPHGRARFLRPLPSLAVAPAMPWLRPPASWILCRTMSLCVVSVCACVMW